MSTAVAFWLVASGMALVAFVLFPAWVGLVWVTRGPHPRYVEKFPQLAEHPYTTRAGRVSDLKARGLFIFTMAALGLWAGISIGLAFAARAIFA